MQFQRIIESEGMRKASMAIIAFFVLMTSSYLAIPMRPVPITMQSLAVVLTGILLGARFGAFVVAFWVIAGLSGCPVLAMGNGGWDELLDPTAGYLYSFPLVAYVAAKLEKNRSNLQTFSSLLIAQLLCLFLGAAWLAMYVGIHDAVLLGIVPFVIGAVLKSLIGTLILFALFRQPNV